MLRLQGWSPDKIEEFVNVSVHGLSIVSRKAAENDKTRGDNRKHAATSASMLPCPRQRAHSLLVRRAVYAVIAAEQSREQQSRDRVTAEQSRVTHTRAEQGDTHVRDSSRAEQRAAEQSREQQSRVIS